MIGLPIKDLWLNNSQREQTHIRHLQTTGIGLIGSDFCLEKICLALVLSLEVLYYSTSL